MKIEIVASKTSAVAMTADVNTRHIAYLNFDRESINNSVVVKSSPNKEGRREGTQPKIKGSKVRINPRAIKRKTINLQ